MCFLRTRGKPEYPEKTSRCRVENQQTQPTYDAEFKNWSRATLIGNECFHHYASPALPILTLAELRVNFEYASGLCYAWLPRGENQFDRQSSLQTSQKDKNDRIPFTLTFHPHNHAVKSIILNNSKLLQNDPETGRIFSQSLLFSFKRDKNVSNFLVRSALKTNEQPGTFKCTRSRCKTCLFIVNTSKISGPKRSVKITDRFTCTSANVIFCITT